MKKLNIVKELCDINNVQIIMNSPGVRNMTPIKDCLKSRIIIIDAKLFPPPLRNLRIMIGKD